MQPPFVQLGPGSTGTQVDQLQKWLVQLGYLSSSDYQTGPGTYGPKTTAAVTKLQQTLGVNNSSGPGYWGPQTISSVQSDFGYSAAANSPTSSGTTTAGTSTPSNTATALTTTSSSNTQSSTPSNNNLNLQPVPQSQAVTGSLYAPQGYNLPANGSYIKINGNAYRVNSGGILIPASAIGDPPAWYSNAPDISTFAPGYVAPTSNTGTPSPTGGTIVGGTLQDLSINAANGQSGTSSTAATGNAYNPLLANYGITSDVFAQASAVQQAQMLSIVDKATTLYSNSGGTVTREQAMAAAANDPNIISKYADQAKLDANAFQQSLQQIQTATSTTAQNQKTQFENERKQLADASAAAGQAYSGFRNKAQQDLAQNEQGIVTSTRSQLQQNLQDLTTQFESKYGSAAATAATASYVDPYAASNISVAGQYSPTTAPASTLSGTLAGGITGSQQVAKAADIASTASNLVTLGQVPNTVPAQ